MFLNSWMPPRGVAQAAHYVLCEYACEYHDVMAGGISVGHSLRVIWPPQLVLWLATGM